MPTSFEVSQSLLTVERQKERAGSTGFPAAPIGLGIINFLFCVDMENYIRADPTNHYLLLFMFVECAGVALVCCGVLVRTMTAIINRTSIFPIGTWSYLLFLMIGLAKRPVIMVLVVTTGLLVGVVAHDSMVQLLLSAMYLLLAMTVVLATVATVSLKLIRSSQPATMLGLLAASAIVAIVGAMLVFNSDSLLQSVPVVGWTVHGITAARNGDTTGIIRPFVYTAAALAALGILGRTIR